LNVLYCTGIEEVFGGGKRHWQSSGCCSVPNVCSRAKKEKKKKKEETPHEHLQTEKQENKRSEKERVRNSGTYYNTKKIKKKP
jgi:hypothetical protein